MIIVSLWPSSNEKMFAMFIEITHSKTYKPQD